MSLTVRRTAPGQRLPDRIMFRLKTGAPATLVEIAAELCSPGGDAVSRCRRSLEVLAGRGLVVRDGDRWRSAG